MTLKEQKNTMKNCKESAFVMYKPLYLEKNDISLQRYSNNIYTCNTQSTKISLKNDQINTSDNKKSWGDENDILLKNSIKNTEYFYFVNNIFRYKGEVLKRLVDIVISLIALLILFPIFIIVAYKVRKNLGSPVFFYQERPGKNGKLFRMIKFRSMKDLCAPDGSPLPDEQRITPFGQKLRATSLDEMPQLINVLKGDMSIVGPRPMLKEFVELYSPEQARRLNVRPGMTGLAQVSGRNELDYEERFKYDVWYVNNHNLWVDCKIMFKTVIVMAKCEGINAPGHVGPSLFKGNNFQSK